MIESKVSVISMKINLLQVFFVGRCQVRWYLINIINLTSAVEANGNLAQLSFPFHSWLTSNLFQGHLGQNVNRRYLCKMLEQKTIQFEDEVYFHFKFPEEKLFVADIIEINVTLPPLEELNSHCMETLISIVSAQN